MTVQKSFKLVLVSLCILIFSTALFSLSEKKKIELTHPKYVGVKFLFVEDSIVELDKYYSKYISAKSPRPGSYPEPDVDFFQEELIKRFDEMVATYQNNKAALPGCLQTALDCFFANLKKKNSGAELRINWGVSGLKNLNPPTGNENPEHTVYAKFVKQDAPITASDANHISGNGTCSDAMCGRPHWGAKNIEIYNAHKKLCRLYSPKCNCSPELAPIRKRLLTSSIIFHELLHLIRWKHSPKCLRSFACKEIPDGWIKDSLKYDNSRGDLRDALNQHFENSFPAMEEAIAEDGTAAVFGKANTNDFYRVCNNFPKWSKCVPKSPESKNECSAEYVCVENCRCKYCRHFGYDE